jgi:UDP-glucose 6-dehydrogenase
MSRLGQSGDAEKTRRRQSDLCSYLEASGQDAEWLCIIVTASIVPVGIGDAIEESLAVRPPRVTFESSNPEFLREGHAMASSILTGSSLLECEGSRARMAQFYTPRVSGWRSPYTDRRSAETTPASARQTWLRCRTSSNPTTPKRA